MRHRRLWSNAPLLRRDGLAVGAVSLSLLMLAGAVPSAKAQVAASASLVTDYRYRGVSVSDARPAIGFDLGYDRPGGGYAGGSLVAADAPGAGPRLVGALADVGYARRVGGDLTLDVGVSHASFFRYDYGSQSAENTEVYAGLTRGRLRAYLYYSPHYFVSGLKTLYFSLDGSAPAIRRLRLIGHVGVLDNVGSSAQGSGDARYDLRVGIAAPFRNGVVQLAWTTRGGGFSGPPGTPPRRGALVLGANWFF